MSSASFRRWVVFVGCVLLVGATRVAPAQLPQSFSVIPGDASLILRVDVGAMENHPTIGPELKTRTDANPDYWSDLMSMMDDEPANDEDKFPGKIRIFELGVALEENMDDPPVYAVMYGQWDKAEVESWIQGHQEMQQTSTHLGSPIYTSADGDYAAALPNDWAVVLSESTELVTRVLDTWAGSTISVRSPESPLGSISGGGENAIMYFAVRLPAEARQEMAAMTQQMAADPNSAMMMGPVLPAVQSLAGLESLVISVPAQGDLGLNVALIYTAPEFAGQFVQGWAGGMQMVQQMAMMMAQADPAQAADMQKLAAVRFTPAGNRALGRIPFEAKDLFEGFDQLQDMGPNVLDGLPPMPGMPGSKQ